MAWISDAYAYLLGRVLVIRQETIDAADPDFTYNRVKYNPLGSADFVNPNLDVAYLEAWFAVDEEHPAVLEVPMVEGRYYTAQILDEWGEVIVNINERATPAKSHGQFALTAPGSDPAIPAGASRIDLRSGKAKMLARVELRGDTDEAVRLQHEFTVTDGAVTVPTPPAVPDFDNAHLPGVELFDNLDAILASALDVSPSAVDLQLKARAVREYAHAHPDARARVDQLLNDQVIPDFHRWTASHMGATRNHWMGGSSTGVYGDNYRLRTAANLIGIWANSSSEVIYFQAARDDRDQLLDGSNTYLLHFAADELPDAIAHAYWSVILVSVPDYRVVPNPLNRYNLNSHSPLAFGDDGSLTIAIGPSAPQDVPQSNWIPSPPGEPFTLTFRAYVPREPYLPPHGTWAPPALTRTA